jgi:hypothetical protein
MFDLFRQIAARIKAASARFSEAFWRGYEEARAQSRAAPMHSLDEVIVVSIRAGRQAEPERIAEILRLPGADRFPRLAASLALAEIVAVEQAIEVLAVAESDVFTRPQPTESSPLESSSSHVLH